MNKIWLLVVVCCWVFSSCKQGNSVKQNVSSSKATSLDIKYARGFSVDYYSGYKVLTVKDWNDTTNVFAQYILPRRGVAAAMDFPHAVFLEGPFKKVICISTNHISALSRLGLVDSIAGVANVGLIYNAQIIELVKQGRIADVGRDELNYERIVELNPSCVFTSGSWDGGDKMKLKLNSLGIKSVLNLDFREQEPLARAEWLKFVAAFYDRESEADSIFSEIERNYLSLKSKVANVASQPTVFTNLPFKEIWYMPCGENYMARIIADAGGDFLWKDTKATNGLNLNLDYEAVYAKAADADVWLSNGFAGSLAELQSADKKNAFFKAFKTGNVFNNDKRNTPNGGFDFWESGVFAPDIILADLIYIFHPELLPEHELFYYRQLK
jgi:iron complex transport system substrate-binding protein